MTCPGPSRSLHQLPRRPPPVQQTSYEGYATKCAVLKELDNLDDNDTREQLILTVVKGLIEAGNYEPIEVLSKYLHSLEAQDELTNLVETWPKTTKDWGPIDQMLLQQVRRWLEQKELERARNTAASIRNPEMRKTATHW